MQIICPLLSILSKSVERGEFLHLAGSSEAPAANDFGAFLDQTEFKVLVQLQSTYHIVDE